MGPAMILPLRGLFPYDSVHISPFLWTKGSQTLNPLKPQLRKQLQSSQNFSRQQLAEAPLTWL